MAELESGSAFDHEANPLQFAPQLPPQLCWRLADHQHHPPRVQQRTSGRAEHAFAQPKQAPAFAGGALHQHPGGVHDVVGERVEQQDHLVLGERVDRCGALFWGSTATSVGQLRT